MIDVATESIDGEAVPPPIPAATVVLLRDGDTELETLMLRKNARLTFGGMWVFPGGRLDPADGDGVDGARHAAVREAMEEAAVAVDPGTLIPFAHWTPPGVAPKRFATWFFLAPTPAGAEVTIDGGEIHDHLWVTPRAALERQGYGEVELAPPTWVTLHHLAECPDVASALTAASEAELERYETVLSTTKAGGELVVLWHGDAGYESADASVTGARHRLTMAPGPWVFERTHP
ncbi:MAG: NUDIX hydrolase [Acidimicrobiales bacterium]